MGKGRYILAIDQGTTSSRALIFDENFQVSHTAQQEFQQYFPQSGWVEHDAEEIWSSTLAVCKQAIAGAGLETSDILAVGITNQRETTVVWDKNTGEVIYPAIVWQDRRTAEYCDSLADHADDIRQRTGLIIDSYFSATKIRWILENIIGARARAERGELLFGTIDCFLIWRLTQGVVHATDATNAARTMLFNIAENCWDSTLLALFDIPAAMLPEVKDCAADYGQIAGQFLAGHSLPIAGVAGDQQSAAIGQACLQAGMIKSTYGTGCFALMNTGNRLVYSQNRMLTTIAYRLNSQISYALEGSIFVAGAVVQWLRDGLQIIEKAQDVSLLAEGASGHEEVYFVPAFTGLGAPYWRSEVRGAMFGLTRGTGREDIARAALESVAFQTRDLVQAMLSDMGIDALSVLRVDGGMSQSDWTMQMLADQLAVRVDRPLITETTALGVAYLAAYQCGLIQDFADCGQYWQREREFSPQQPREQVDRRYAGWRDAVAKLF